MPTSSKVKKKLKDVLLKIHAQEVAELGSGFGGLLSLLTQTLPHAKITAFELSLFPYWISKLLFFSQKRVSLLRKNFLKQDLTKFDCAVCYLYPGAMQALSLKLKNITLISIAFALPGHQPTLAFQADDLFKTWIYVYDL